MADEGTSELNFREGRHVSAPSVVSLHMYPRRGGGGGGRLCCLCLSDATVGMLNFDILRNLG